MKENYLTQSANKVFFALVLMALIVVMVLPMPSWVLDIGLAASFALAILIFTVALFIDRPLDFSIFPTVLLASLMLRLALNISSTKLIIGQGHTGTGAAGHVIESFASFIMGGSVFLGIVVFLILLIVNFVVITKGATRMAEVSARFALDGMPGKQIAIDSDVSAGAIDHEEAKSRREREQQETNFFGSLDGASKFVKGDAIAGLLITLLNFLMGLLVGTLQHGMSLSASFETYAILTVGDGLVNQIPAVVISVASALLLARGGASGSIDKSLIAQFGRYPAALFTVALLMTLFAFVPGLPFFPFLLGALVVGTAAFFASKSDTNSVEIVETDEANLETMPKEASLGDVLDLDDIHVQFATDLVAMALDPATGLDVRITSMRNHIASEFGLILPEIRLTDDPSLLSGQYTIRIQGVVQAKDIILPGKKLAILSGQDDDKPIGDEVKEPVYGAPACWIDPSAEEDIVISGVTVVSPAEVLATHLLEVIKSNFSRLLNLRALRRLLDEFVNLSDRKRAEANRSLIDELVPEKVPVELLLSVLRLLLDERVSIRNLAVILETISELRGAQSSPEAICEMVRHRLGFQIIEGLKRADGTLPLVQLAPEWEETFASYQVDGERGRQDIALPPEDFNRLTTAVSQKIADVGENGIFPAVVTSTQRRRFLRTVLSANGIRNPVLSFEEIGPDARPAMVGLIAA